MSYSERNKSVTVRHQSSRCTVRRGLLRRWIRNCPTQHPLAAMRTSVANLAPRNRA